MKLLQFAIILVAIVLSHSSTHAVTLRTVALTGTQAPGTPTGALFDDFGNFGPPVINSVGETAFHAELRQGTGGVDNLNFQGIWSEDNTTLKLRARSNYQAVGVPAGVNYGVLRDPLIDGQGNAVFTGGLRGADGVTSANDSALWSLGNVTSSLIAREGNQAPGTPVGSVFGNFGSSVRLAVNESGNVSFSGTLQVGVAGVTNDNDSGIWSNANGTLNLLAREGSQAPGTPSGANFQSFENFALNGSGQTFIRATLRLGTGGVTINNDSGMWLGTNSSFDLIVREGDAAPGLAPGVLFEGFTPPRLNDAGQVAFMGQLSGTGVVPSNNRAVWKGTPGSISMVAREDEQAPGTSVGTKFGEFLYAPTLNAAGQTSFYASLQAGSAGVTNDNNTGIWSEGSGTLKLIAREGSNPPDTPANYRFADFQHPDYMPVLNSNGQAAFLAPFWPGAIGPPGSELNGIWAEDENGNLEMIVSEGAKMRVGPNDIRVVRTLMFQGYSGLQDGLAAGFNDSRELVFFARFAGGSEGIFVTQGPVTVPEPVGLSLCILLLSSLCTRRQISR